MKKYLIILLTVIAFGSVSRAQPKNTTVITNLSPERFKAAIAGEKAPMIIDLRTNDEIKNKGYIKGSVQIDYLAKDFDLKLSVLDKSKTYYIYCAAGGRSGDCAEQMEKQGFKRVFNLEKGFSDWAAKGMPIERK